MFYLFHIFFILLGPGPCPGPRGARREASLGPGSPQAQKYGNRCLKCSFSKSFTLCSYVLVAHLIWVILYFSTKTVFLSAGTYTFPWELFSCLRVPCSCWRLACWHFWSEIEQSPTGKITSSSGKYEIQWTWNRYARKYELDIQNM